MTSPQVFISYQRADEAFARQVREHLTAHGVRAWMDQYDIPVGAYWPDEIDKGLAGSDTVVGILSPDAVASRNVKNEWDWAIQHDKRLVLLQARSSDIPHRYISINFIDATSPDRTDALAALLATFGLAEGAAGQRLDNDPSPEPAQRIRHSRRSLQRRFPDEPLLAGRAEPQARLRVALDAMLAERGQLVLLGGEAGIGKTTLTNWLGWAAEERGAVVVTGGCYDLSTTPPYGPWLEILRAWPEADGAPPVPDALRGGEAMARLAGQAALLGLAADFLSAGSDWRPLVLVLEDLHWADQATLDLLRHMIRPILDARIMLVATYRDDEITRHHPLFTLLPGLVRESITTPLVLPRLDEGGLRELIAARFPLAVDDADRLVDYLRRQTEGNPFFSGEVLAALVEGGAIVRDGDDWRLTNLERVQVPGIVRQVIERRLALLGDDAQRHLAVAAVIGHETPVDLWVAISGADEDSLSDTLERATEAHMIVEMRAGSGFRFAHALIRETLYEGLSLLRRRSLHRQVGEALAAGPRPDPDAVAHHFRQAGDPRAFDWLVAAGQRAVSGYAMLMAAERYEQAAVLIADDPARVREFGWLLAEIAGNIRYVEVQRATRLMEEAAEVGDAAGDVWLALRSRLNAGYYRCLGGQLRRGVDEMVAVSHDMEVTLRDGRLAAWTPVPGIHVTDDAPNFAYLIQVAIERPDRAVAIWSSLAAGWLSAAGRYREAQELAEQLAEVWPADIDAAGPVSVGKNARDAWGDLYNALKDVYQELGRPEAMAHAGAIALRIYESIPHHVLVMLSHKTMLDNLIRYGTDNVEQLQRIADATQQAQIRAEGAIASGPASRIMMAPLLLLEGHWAEARDTLANGYAQARGQRDDLAELFAEPLAMCYLWQGRSGDARQLIAEMLPDGPATEPGDYMFVAGLALLRVGATIALDEGDLTGARAWIECHDRWLAWSGAVPGQADGHLLWSRYHQLAGDLAAAEDRARQALRSASEPRQPLLLLAADRALGELLTVVGRDAEANEHLHASLTLADACAAPFERALTLVALAALDIATTADASEKLAEARAICERLEARPTLERIAALERQCAGG